tara:strand:- start:190 stop:423 length:234 start_codon:yes stop_codon:yes gene_type:complete
MKKKPSTTIKIHKETKDRLDHLREHERETYEEILKKILFILNTSRKNPERARSLMIKLDRSIKNKKEYNAVYQKEEK